LHDEATSLAIRAMYKQLTNQNLKSKSLAKYANITNCPAKILANCILGPIILIENCG